jgi:hypothetical protein
MIHLVIREPIAYQRTLCRVLNDHYRGDFVAWFASGEEGDFTTRDDFARRFLRETGFAKLFSALRADANPVVILGGWSSQLAYKTLLITSALRVPTLIWADHPHPHPRSWAFENLRLMYLRLLSARTVAFLGCGTPTVEHLTTLGIPRAKIFNFPYWVEMPTEWSPPRRVSEENSESKPLRLLAIGRLVSMKGFDAAIKAVALANQIANRGGAELSIIGDGPERESLEQLVGSLAVASSVTFTGRLKHSAVCEHLRDADALIVPSTFEPYGVVVLEALAHGRPVLASDRVIAALDKANNSGAIRLHRAGDTNRLAAQINLLANDRTVLREASHAARKIAEVWKPERAAEILQAILNERLGREIKSVDHDPQTLYQTNAQPTSNAS